MRKLFKTSNEVIGRFNLCSLYFNCLKSKLLIVGNKSHK